MPNENEPNVTGYIPIDPEYRALSEAASRAGDALRIFLDAYTDSVFCIAASLILDRLPRTASLTSQFTPVLKEYLRLRDAYFRANQALDEYVKASATQAPPSSLPGTLHDYLSDK